MKKTFYYFGIFLLFLLLSMTIIYGFISFIKNEPNPLLWSQKVRIIWAIFSFSGGALLLFTHIILSNLSKISYKSFDYKENDIHNI
jgi:hypothetical protein